jgi:hypothetical protein
MRSGHDLAGKGIPGVDLGGGVGAVALGKHYGSFGPIIRAERPRANRK